MGTRPPAASRSVDAELHAHSIAPPAGSDWSFGGRGASGDLRIRLEGDWQEGQRLLLALTHRTARGEGGDLQTELTLTGQPDFPLERCVSLICFQIETELGLQCVSEVGAGVAEIRVASPDGTEFASGSMSVCTQATAPAFEVTGFDPPSA